MKLKDLFETPKRKFDTFLFSTFGPEETEIPKFTVWVPVKHGGYPQFIMVTRTPYTLNEVQNSMITIDDLKITGNLQIPPLELSKIFDWIRINKKALTRHWTGKTSSSGLGNELKKIPLTESVLLEMANCIPSETGIKGYSMWVSTKFSGHVPRVKVCKGTTWNEDESATVTISSMEISGKLKLTGKALTQVTKWVEDNKELILRLWNKEITQSQFKKEMKSI